MHAYYYHVVMHMLEPCMYTNIFIDYLTPSKTLYISPYVVHCLFNTLHSRQAVPADSLIYIILLISKMHDVPKRL